MAGTKEIKRRIRSVKNTKKITKAMELVAASKMKRAVSRALASRLYAGYSWELLTSLSGKLDEQIEHPFFTAKEKGKVLILLITSNRGLCGGYNAQAIKKSIATLKHLNNIEEVDLMTIGKKGDAAMRRVGQNVVASFVELPDILKLSDISSISNLITEEYKKDTYKEVYVVYTDFISALSQKPNVRRLLPVSASELRESIQSVGEEKDIVKLKNQNTTNYVFEGDTNALLGELAQKLVKMQVYQMLLESNASEQSARMISMKNAGDAATEMIDDLTLMFNKARQANITREISEISAGMASVS